MLAPSAWHGLRDHLRSRLVFALGPALRLELHVARAIARSETNANRAGRVTLLGTIQDFPGALETAAQLISNWIDAQSELLCRLGRDRKVIGRTFFTADRTFRVVGLSPGLSDPHDRGRTVTVVEFAGKRRVVYKPRPCDEELFWFCALKWLNQNGIVCSFKIPQLLARKNYCWMEYLRPSGCPTLAAVQEFYFRWGAQTALAQILGASDLHRENWLAAGAQPILVDAEMIGAVDRQPLGALLETGLLPLIARDRAGSYRGIAPFDAAAFDTSPPACWPRWNGKAQPPAKYLDDLIGGFQAIARVFAKPQLARQFFAEIALPMSRRRRGRILYRASAEYGRLLRESLEPVMMSLPGKRRRWLASKCRESSINRSTGRTEARALLGCDIPKFTTRIPAPSRLRFLAAAAELKSSARVLRRRIYLAVAPAVDLN